MTIPAIHLDATRAFLDLRDFAVLANYTAGESLGVTPPRLVRRSGQIWQRRLIMSLLEENTRTLPSRERNAPLVKQREDIVAGQSLLDSRRCPAPSESRNGHSAGRGNAWSYYVFRQGVRLLQRKGAGQRISINGVSGTVVLEP